MLYFTFQKIYLYSLGTLTKVICQLCYLATFSTVKGTLTDKFLWTGDSVYEL